MCSMNERENSTIVINGRNSTLLVVVLLSFLSTTWSCRVIELKVDDIIVSTPLSLVIVEVD